MDTRHESVLHFVERGERLAFEIDNGNNKKLFNITFTIGFTNNYSRITYKLLHFFILASKYIQVKEFFYGFIHSELKVSTFFPVLLSLCTFIFFRLNTLIVSSMTSISSVAILKFWASKDEFALT